MPSISTIRRRPRRLLRISLSVVFLLFIIFIINKLFSSNEIQSLSCSQLCPYSSELTNNTLQFDSSHIIRHFPNFVCPQNFRNLADWVYGWPNEFNERLQTLTDDKKNIVPCLPSGSIIYVCIWFIDEFFTKIYPHLQNDFVLITGEGDISTPTHLKYLQAVDSKIIHWFGQNGQYNVSAFEKFTHIPIGINCFQMADGIQSVYSQQPNHTLPPIFNDPDEPSAYVQPQDISHRVLTTITPTQNLVLINFDVVTDRTGLRSRIRRTMCWSKNREIYPYVTCIFKGGGIDIEDLPKLYERNRQYPFWLSPRGGGLDCHRTWEALYLDIIPIVWNSSLNVLYENLPVVIINDYIELNETFLYKKLREISTKKLSKGKIYQYEKLRNAYWRRLILNKSRHRNKKNIHKRTEQCWRAKTTINWRRILSFFNPLNLF
ncbi:unnamed protein product [Adineta steineri]|uniref:Uncharacterized protein n=1 Tax=Adineta steineri TaxID=433720 RepID=A0A818IMW2_9BILA|nr:unnamed protein product [Adineta steineri]CAF3526144.1 unnamed protein product [Adineta steineri]